MAYQAYGSITKELMTKSSWLNLKKFDHAKRKVLLMDSDQSTFPKISLLQNTIYLSLNCMVIKNLGNIKNEMQGHDKADQKHT